MMATTVFGRGAGALAGARRPRPGLRTIRFSARGLGAALIVNALMPACLAAAAACLTATWRLRPGVLGQTIEPAVSERSASRS